MYFVIRLLFVVTSKQTHDNNKHYENRLLFNLTSNALQVTCIT